MAAGRGEMGSKREGSHEDVLYPFKTKNEYLVQGTVERLGLTARFL